MTSELLLILTYKFYNIKEVKKKAPAPLIAEPEAYYYTYNDYPSLLLIT